MMPLLPYWLNPSLAANGKKSAKGRATDDAALASAIASHAPVAAAAAAPIALISAAPPSSFDTDQAAAAHMATDDAPSKRNAVKAKKAPAKNARALTAMAVPPVV